MQTRKKSYHVPCSGQILTLYGIASGLHFDEGPKSTTIQAAGGLKLFWRSLVHQRQTALIFIASCFKLSFLNFSTTYKITFKKYSEKKKYSKSHSLCSLIWWAFRPQMRVWRLSRNQNTAHQFQILWDKNLQLPHKGNNNNIIFCCNDLR